MGRKFRWFGKRMEIVKIDKNSRSDLIYGRAPHMIHFFVEFLWIVQCLQHFFLSSCPLRASFIYRNHYLSIKLHFQHVASTLNHRTKSDFLFCLETFPSRLLIIANLLISPVSSTGSQQVRGEQSGNISHSATKVKHPSVHLSHLSKRFVNSRSQ